MAETHRADARHFLDERGSTSSLAPNGLNPATILERAVINRIVNNTYFYKEQCFGINEADVVERCARHVTYVGGTYGDAQTASPFLCLAFKLLQLAPGDDVVRAYLGRGGARFKYLRALACFYVRLTRPARAVHALLEPWLADPRKLRRRTRHGWALTFVDAFVDELLTRERVCGTSLWQMPRRAVLEDLEVVGPRVSALGDVAELLDGAADGAGRSDGTGEEAGAGGHGGEEEGAKMNGEDSGEEKGGGAQGTGEAVNELRASSTNSIGSDV